MDTHRLSQTVQPLLGWFQAHARALPWRADREPYHVWLSEIMLQQTRVEAVRGYYARFLAAAPDVFALAALPEGAARNIYRIVLTGETDRAPNPAALRAALEGRVFALQLRDETRARRDLWARAGESTLRGQFLAQLKQQYDAADSDRARETIVMAARWGLAALDHDEEVVTL